MQRSSVTGTLCFCGELRKHVRRMQTKELGDAREDMVARGYVGCTPWLIYDLFDEEALHETFTYHAEVCNGVSDGVCLCICVSAALFVRVSVSVSLSLLPSSTPLVVASAALLAVTAS